MKLIIVDDERKICQLLEVLIDWEKFGIDIAGTASNGNEAIELAEAVKPDIVLTDIMMPGCDGLEMIRRVKENNPEVHFVIISGYPDFDYARKAIRYGVNDFLTKPVQKDELEGVLYKIIDEKAENDRQREDVEQLRNTVQRQSKQIKETFLSSVVSGERELTDAHSAIEDINSKWHCGFREGMFRIFIVKPDFIETEEYEMIYQRLNEKACEMCCREFQDECYELICVKLDIGTCVLLNYPESGMKDLRWRLRHIRINVAESHGDAQEVHVTIGVGSPVNDISRIMESYRGAERAILNRVMLGTDKMIGVAKEVSETERGFDPFAELNNDFMSRFLNAVDVFDIEGIKGLLQKLKEVCSSNSRCDGYTVFTALNELFVGFVKSLGKNKDISYEENAVKRFRQTFYRCILFDEIFSRMFGLMTELIEREKAESRQAEVKPIQQAKAYIQSHYRERLTLEVVSSIAGFNANYFSGVFKRETDKTLTEYILEVRMDKAKELLKNRHMKISEIPEKVGIGDAKYFAKQFKKVTGLSPSQYRKFFG